MLKTRIENFPQKPKKATGILVLEDGSVFWGKGFGKTGVSTGELVFNTAISGYQEIISDPSYASQIITFTFPHIGNVGVNPDDVESSRPHAVGCITRMDISEPSNWRSVDKFQNWIKTNNLTGISCIDTRQVTSHLRDNGAQNATISFNPNGEFDVGKLLSKSQNWPGLLGNDLAREVSCKKAYTWTKKSWSRVNADEKEKYLSKINIVVIDFGVKNSILRSLVDLNCNLTVVPANSSFDEILKHNPDGILLSNGPGDPQATGIYAIPLVKKLIKTNLPIFGICLGHQILALALGAKTFKLKFGHHGSNQPVKNLRNERVEITSQNHGFCVDRNSLPEGVIETHRSLFDGVLEGLEVTGKPIFSVQYHPEASPGPKDSSYLFVKFIELVKNAQEK